MPWWINALYDTCSLITLDKMLLDHPEMAVHFQGVLAIEASFGADQLRRDTAVRMQPRVTSMEVPAPPVLARILAATRLSQALAQVDKLVFVTAVHHGLTVITGDKRLAQSVARGAPRWQYCSRAQGSCRQAGIVRDRLQHPLGRFGKKA